MAGLSWTSQDGTIQFRELIKALLETVPHNTIMEVDNKVRNAGEGLASPTQGWLVLWVQHGIITTGQPKLHLIGTLGRTC
jgi:hypothetical protein